MFKNFNFRFHKNYRSCHSKKSLLNLKDSISSDSYLKAIPFFHRTLIEGFHAKNDTPEIREKFFKLIKTLDFKAELFVARKIESLFLKRHEGKEELFLMTWSQSYLIFFQKCFLQ